MERARRRRTRLVFATCGRPAGAPTAPLTGTLDEVSYPGGILFLARLTLGGRTLEVSTSNYLVEEAG